MPEKDTKQVAPDNLTSDEMIDLAAKRAAQRIVPGSDSPAPSSTYGIGPINPDDPADPDPVEDPADVPVDPLDKDPIALMQDPQLAQNSSVDSFMVGPTDYERTLMNVSEALRESGEFTDQQIDDFMRPPQGMQDDNLDPLLLMRAYEIAKPEFEENHQALAAARQLFDELEGQGLDRDTDINWSVIRQFANIYSEDMGLGLSGLARWRRRMARKFGENAALFGPGSTAEFQYGMALLDGMSRWVNSFRIQSLEWTGELSKQEELDLVKEFLPPVRTLNPRTGEEDFYASQFGARWSLGWDYTKSMWRMAAHQGLSWANTLIGRDEQSTLHDRLKEEAKTDALDAAAMMPQVAMSHVPPLQVLEGLEGTLEPETVAKIMTDPYLTTLGMNMSEEDRQRLIATVEEQGSLWPVWNEINQSEDRLMTILEMVAYNTGSEIVWDPVILFSGAPSKVVSTSRRLFGKVAPRARARATSLVAQNTGDLTDAKEAVQAARELGDRVMRKANKAAEANGGVMPKENYQEVINVQHQIANEERYLADFTRKIESDPVALDKLKRAGRRNPDFMPESTYKVKVKKSAEPEAPAPDLFNAEERAIHYRRQAAIERGGIKPKMETVIEKRTKTVEELGEEQAKFRVREGARERDWALDLELERTMEHPTSGQRLLFGPDDMEQGGDTLNHLVRTGGEGIDDATITPPAAEYSWDPVKVSSRLEWDMVRDVTRTEAEVGFRRGTFQLDLGDSAYRTILREEDRIRRAYGAARRLGIKEDIQILAKELKTVRSTRRKIAAGLTKKERKLIKEGKYDKQFDEGWAGAQPTSLRKAGKLERWIRNAPDQMARALYPDAYHLTSDRKMGHFFAPMRDPLRFLRTYHPKLGEQLRLGYRRYDHHVLAHQEIFENVLERAGVIERKPRIANPKKDFAQFNVNQQKSEELFDLLDARKGSKKFTERWAKADEATRKAHDEIRAVLDDFADQQGLTGTSRYLQGYMRHVITGEEFSRNARPLEFIGLSGKAEVFVSHLLRRKGAGKSFEKDLVMILDLYNRAARRKQFLEPVFYDMNTAARQLSLAHRNTKFGNYLKATNDVLQGRSSFLGKALDAFNGRPIDAKGNVLFRPNKLERTLTGVTTALWMTSIPFNPRYGLMQMTAGISTTGARYGMLRTQAGMMRMMTKEGQYMARKLGFYDTVNEIMESNSLRGMADMLGDYTGINRIEAYIRGVTAHAAMDLRMTELGIQHWKQAVGSGQHQRIMFDAMRAAENVNHMYGPLARSPYINRILGQPAGSAMTQFTLYPLKQTEELINLANQNPGKVAEYFMISGWMNRLFAQHVGYDVTRWTGLGYADELSTGNIESGDAKAVEVAGRNVATSIQTLIPVLARDLAKMHSRLKREATTNSKGQMVRRLFHGESEDILRHLAESLDPGLGTRKDPAPGLGGDLVPTLTMGPGIRDRVQRLTTDQMFRQKSKDIVDMRALFTDIADGLEDGELEKVNTATRALIERHGMRIDKDAFKDRVKGMLLARWMSANMRMLEENPQYRELWLQQMMQSGAGTGME